MTVRTFVIGSMLAALAGSGAFALTVTQLDPEAAGWIGFALFFLSLFVAVASFASLLGFAVRRFLMWRQFPSYAVRTSVRQGGLIAAFVSVLLLLQLVRLYQWWLAIVLIVLFVSLELVFLGYDRAYARRYQDPDGNRRS